jgi:HK97 family phage major capsid protein
VPNNLTKGTSNAASDAFVGQFDQCMIGMRTALTMEISRTAAETGGSAFTSTQVWIRAYLRADVQLAHPSAFVVLNGIL